MSQKVTLRLGCCAPFNALIYLPGLNICKHQSNNLQNSICKRSKVVKCKFDVINNGYGKIFGNYYLVL